MLWIGSRVATVAPNGLASGQQSSGKIALISGDGFRIVFNDRSDPDYIGPLVGPDAVTGLDGYEVRESTEDRTDAHGATSGPSYAGRRPVTLAGAIVPEGASEPAAMIDRNIKLGKLRRVASSMMVRDGTMIFQPAGGYEMQTRLRLQQPPRTPGAWVKDFQLALVAQDPLLYSTEWVVASAQGNAPGGIEPISYDLNGDVNSPWGTTHTQLSVTNAGNAGTFLDPNDPGAPFVATIQGPGTNPVLFSATAESALFFNAITLGNYDVLVIDSATGNITLNGENANGLLYIPRSRWFGMMHGANDFRLGFSSFPSSPSASLTIAAQHAWL